MAPIIALNPVSPGPGISTRTRPALAELSGKTVGFLSNNKPNADALLGRMAARLADRFRISARHYNKGAPSLPAPEALLEEIGRDCHAVVLAIND
jgi:hypothetical protein